MASTRVRGAPVAADRPELIAALRSCATEADVAQVLFQGLRSRFRYDVLSLQVLEREGWYHVVAVDEGILQDIRRRRLEETMWAPYYTRGEASVYQVPATSPGINPSRGLGAARVPQTAVFVPFEHGGQVTGAVLYQTYDRRDVLPGEIEELREIHRHLGVVVANAYLNELTRNQAVRLTALNTVARALASTLDEGGVVSALHESLSPLLPLSIVAIGVPEPDGTHIRVLRCVGGRVRPGLRLPQGSRRLTRVREVLDTSSAVVENEAPADYPSSVYVPILDRGRARAVLSIHSDQKVAYEESTVTFLEQVADETALAMRNVESYNALEAQRRRLEVVNAVGRRLASSLDRWSIMRTLREELTHHLRFDGFVLAAVTETEDGPVAEGYTYLRGEETDIYTVPLAAAGPSREAYETGRPVLVRRSRWAHKVEAQHPAPETLVHGQGAIIYVGEGGDSSRLATRSLVWVPVRHGDRITALLSLQSFKADAFGDWHVQLLQDVAAHVSLALANAEHFAAAQAERRRLEALHVLELGIAGSADERQIADAVFTAASDYIPNANLVLAYLDPEGRLVGFGFNSDQKVVEQLEPRPPEATNYFRRVQESGRTAVGRLDDEERRPGTGWRSQVDPRMPAHVAWIPVVNDGRVVAAISAQRIEDRTFSTNEVTLLESAAPVVGIALRTVRLHRANELALAHSVRMQEVAALAGHDLATVVSSIAEQARTMLAASGTACWAIDTDGRVSAEGGSGDAAARRVLEWAGQPVGGRWADPPREPVSGVAGGMEWSLIPLWYAHVLVGALGSIHTAGAVDVAASGVLDFARHAAIAIENARLGAETRDRIRTLEAVAAFTELDVIQPAHTREEMAHLIERALDPGGSLWLLDGDELVSVGHGAHRVRVADPAGLARDLRHDTPPLRARALLHDLIPAAGVTATPVLVDGRLGGLVVVEGRTGSYAETRRLMSVLAGQAGVVLGRLRLVDALERERRMMDAILRHSPVGVILEDETGRVIYANPEAEQLYGVAADAMTGRELVTILREAGAELRPDPEAEPGAPLVLKMNEPERVIEVRRVAIPGAADEAASTLSMHEDVTEERQMLEAKDLMLRAIGHEVRSPAAAMRSTLAGILQWENVMDPGQRSTLLAEAYEMSDRLLSLVEGQLIIAKLETRRFEPNPARVALDQAVEHVMAVLRHRYGDRISRVSVRLPRSLRDAFCEPTHLEQVLTNLIGNALEYTTAPIHVTARAVPGDWLEVTVADEGQGLPAERVESLFRKTGPAGQNRARGGLGLGLYFCRLVVERSFGGRIWLAATGRGGSTFKFTVPSAVKVALTAVSGG